MSSAPASSLILPSLQKLKGEENYAQWVRAIEAIADQFDLHKYYHPKAPAGPPRIDEFSINVVDKEEQQKLKTWKEWVAQEAKMRQAIEYNLHPGPMAVIATERTAKDMWAKLKSQYEGSGTVLEYSAIKDYVRQTVFDFPNLETFINHFQKSCEKLITLDLTDVRKWHPTMFVMAVKDQYPIWAERQRSNIRSNPGISLSTLIADLVDEARGDQGRTNSDLAMVGSTTGKGKGKGKSHNNSESRGNLHHCRCRGNPQARHTTEKCFEDPKNEDAKLSWEKRNKKKWVDFKSKKTLQNSKKGKNEYHIGGDSDDDKPSSFAGIVNTSAISSRANSFVLPVSLQSACVSSVDFLRWIVDTGADRHICRDKKLFDSFLQQESLPMIGTAMGPIRPLGIGTVTLHCKLSSGKTRNVRLTDVLYLPCCPMNLFSGRKLYAQGGYVGNQGSIFDSNNVEIATVDDKLFIIENPRVFAYPAALHQAKPTLPLWHRRLGHLGLKNVKLTEKVTKGIEYVTDTAANLNGEDKTILCEACELSRPLRDVRKDVTPRNLSPFDQISVDVVMIKPSGRILVDESWSKINYATIFTDAATRYRWGIFHKEKKNVFEAVQKFEALSRTQYNCTIKRWRLDGGKEYSPKQMGLMARSLGQIVELTTPYNPEQDGKSERSIGILGARTRAVIIDQKIPQFLWPEIMRTQIFIVNRVANSALNDETPYQALNRLTLGNNEIPDLSHLRVLGCKVYVQIPAEKRVLSHKLDARAEIGILVGYEGSHIFRVYIPSRHTVIRSSNVRFDEDGHITSPQSQSPANQEELKFFENRGESSSAHDNEVSEESNNTDIEWLTPFEELAHGYENPIEEGRTEDNPNQENLTEEVSPPSRNRKTYERVSRVTRSGRSIVPPQPSPDETIAFASFLAATSSTRDPRSVSEALNGPDSSDWRQAFRKEYDSLRDKKTWTYLERSDVPKDKKVLSGKVVMKTKRDKEGAILKRKIRWVVRGFEQLCKVLP